VREVSKDPFASGEGELTDETYKTYKVTKKGQATIKASNGCLTFLNLN
jgi:hypothetical protein